MTVLNNLTWLDNSLNFDNTIPLFFATADWSSIFNYIATSLSYKSESLATSYIVGNHLVDTSSNLINIIFSFFVSSHGYIPNYVAIIAVTVLFGHFYPKFNSVILLSKITDIVQRFWLLNALYYSVYFFLRYIFITFDAFELVTNSGLRLNVIAINAYLRSEQIYYNHAVSLVFLIVLAGIHMFINSLVMSSKQVSPEVPMMTYLIACFAWSLLDLEDFALFLVCLEGFSLTLYILATVGRLYGGISAAIKYFVFGTLGSILLYWGGVSIFELTASMNISTITNLLDRNIEDYNTNYDLYSKAVLAQVFILVGFLIKLGAAPMHQWVADVYAGVPLFITAFYSIFVKLVLFILFLKFAVSFISTKEIEFAAMLSLIVGCFGTLRQVEIKRFLAYGSIAHTGYLLMGDLSATYVYLVTYILASFIFFSVLLSVKLNGREFVYLSDLRFIGQSPNLLDRVILVVVLASMAGLPPFAGFYGKMLVWTSLIEDIYMFNDAWSFVLLLANLLTSLIMMFYYMQVMCTLYANNEEVEENIISDNLYIPENTTNSLITLLQCIGLALLILWTFITPQFLSVANNLI